MVVGDLVVFLAADEDLEVLCQTEGSADLDPGAAAFSSDTPTRVVAASYLMAEVEFEPFVDWMDQGASSLVSNLVLAMVVEGKTAALVTAFVVVFVTDAVCTKTATSLGALLHYRFLANPWC